MGFSTGLFVPWGMQGAMRRDGKLHFLERTLTLVGEESVASEVQIDTEEDSLRWPSVALTRREREAAVVRASQLYNLAHSWRPWLGRCEIFRRKCFSGSRP